MSPDGMPRRATQCDIDRRQKTKMAVDKGSGYNFGLEQDIDPIPTTVPYF
jgi:hypothetical protein